MRMLNTVRYQTIARTWVSVDSVKAWRFFVVSYIERVIASIDTTPDSLFL